jgi:hypothetical protein
MGLSESATNDSGIFIPMEEDDFPRHAALTKRVSSASATDVMHTDSGLDMNMDIPSLLMPATESPQLYIPLPHPDSIRLLSISPGSFNDAITCTLHVVRLSSTIRYESLSYVWGKRSPTGSLHIHLNNRTIPVTPNLYSALRQLRHPHSYRSLWVDQLCINQEDLLERSQQVRLMSQIYRSADRVVVWLGEDNTNPGTAPQAFKLLCDAVTHYSGARGVEPASFHSAHNNVFYESSPEVTLPTASSRSWEAVKTFFNLEWFWRLWVVQEIALASDAIMLWGSSSISWSYVGLAAAFLRTNHYELMAKYNMPGIYNAYIMYRISNNDDVAPPLNLKFLRLLTCTRQFGATDDRDRIFALLGLRSADFDNSSSGVCNNNGNRTDIHITDVRSEKNNEVKVTLFIEPDYTKSMREVYRQAARRIIQQEGNLSILCSVQHGDSLSDSTEEESWVPMWNKVYTHTLTCGDLDGCCNANGGISIDASTLSASADSTLLARGIEVDEIVKVLPVMERSYFEYGNASGNGQDNGVSEAQLDFLQLLRDEFPSPDHKTLAWTLSAGKDWYGLHVTDAGSHMADYYAWLHQAHLAMNRYKAIYELPSITTPSSPPPPQQQQQQQTTDNTNNQNSTYSTSFAALYPLENRPLSPVQNNFLPYTTSPPSLSNTSPPRIHSPSSPPRSSPVPKPGNPVRFTSSAQSACASRRLFLTASGLLGIGPAAAKKGDKVTVLFGGAVPFVMRSIHARHDDVGDVETHKMNEGRIKKQRVRLVGECYVQALMKGEGVEGLKAGRDETVEFLIG